jgi:phosphatidylserine/phosphatidylglycerophosphate/cardiolipin synthase-like enzyme
MLKPRIKRHFPALSERSVRAEDSAAHVYPRVGFQYALQLDREGFQSWYFNWTKNERLKFRFDCCDSFDASHHQKFVVIDGTIAFVGGLDLCSGRWDRRSPAWRVDCRVNC